MTGSIPLPGERVESGWADQPARARGTATMLDIRDDRHDLAAVCRSAVVTTSPASMVSAIPSGDPAGRGTAERLAAAAAERALAIALACARGLGRYRWEGTVRTACIMAATAWVLFPNVAWGDTPCDQPASWQAVTRIGNPSDHHQ
jgi:hypothetical protein